MQFLVVPPLRYDFTKRITCSCLLVVLQLNYSYATDLPAPIIKDEQSSLSLTTPKQVMQKIWVIQLASGNGNLLVDQALKLQEKWPDARVVMVAGQAKLVVGNWQSTSEASAHLTALRSINAQAFIRQILQDSEPFKAMSSTASAIKKDSHSQGRLDKLANQPTTSSPIAQTSPQEIKASESQIQLQEIEKEIGDEDVLPAIVAIANREKHDDETTNQVSETLVEAPTQANEEDNQAGKLTASETVTAIVEKRDIVLPLRKKQTITNIGLEPLAEPVDLMLSPLYFLPNDVMTAKHQVLTMESVLNSLIRTKLSEPQVVASKEDIRLTHNAALENKTKVFSQMVDLANIGRWQAALSLLKTLPLDELHLSYVDHLLAGWIWLQNKQPNTAKAHFIAALKQTGNDEARYGLGICYVLLGDNNSAKSLLKQMQPSQQKEHLHSLVVIPPKKETTHQ